MEQKKNFWENRQTLLTITTLDKSTLPEKIEEAKKMGLKEAGVFLTGLGREEREALYSALQETPIKRIPFAHIRSDMELKELDFFVERYGTEVFNVHAEPKFFTECDFSKYKDITYIENGLGMFSAENLKYFAGICLDLSHLENDRLLDRKQYENIIALANKFKIGCNHISAMKKTASLSKTTKRDRYDSHFLGEMSELDYLKSFPEKYFGKYIAIELDNSLEKQLVAKDYIVKLLES